MEKKSPVDRTFTAATGSPLIAELQLMTAIDEGKFPWSRMLNEKEMRFVYDMLAWAEARSDFMPNASQGRWGVQILWKLRGAAKEWQAGLPRQQSKKSRARGPSSIRLDSVARREAKAVLKKRGMIFDKSSPSDLELALALHSFGAIALKPSKTGAKQALIDWNGARASKTR